jgi:ornithine cyclodeaminase
MPDITILTESDLRDLVPLDHAAIDAVRDAFVALATRPVVMPPVLRLDIAEARGEVDVKTAYLPGLDSFAIKISPGFFDNPKLGLPSLNGLMVVLSARTGLVEALLLDNGYLTDIRTAAAGAVAADCLSRPEASRVLVLGAGLQARLQVRALVLVRPLAAVTCWARDPDRARSYAREMAETLGIPVAATTEPATAAAEADIIVTTTPAAAPVLMADWLRPGQHVTAMGSDSEHKNEVDPAAIGRVRYVADRLSQTRIMGELRAAIAAGVVAADASFAELGAVLAGSEKGRSGADDITLADLTGTGVQDTAIATLALARARAAGAGATFSA